MAAILQLQERHVAGQRANFSSLMVSHIHPFYVFYLTLLPFRTLDLVGVVLTVVVVRADSFEHSVRHSGEGQRLILIVDMLHPDLEGKQGQHYVGKKPP
jgi:hypothetical protein